MADTIEHELKVKARPEEAFRAVGTESGIKGWWAKNSSVAERQGGPVELHFTKPEMTAVMKFEITALEPGRRVQWTCRENSNPIWPGSKLTWEIELAASGSTVRFCHEGLHDGGNHDEIVQGWQFFMRSLEAYLNGNSATPSD